MCKLNRREVLSYIPRDTQLVGGRGMAARAVVIPTILHYVIPLQPQLIFPIQAGIPAALCVPCACVILCLLILLLGFLLYILSLMIDKVGVRNGCLHGLVVSSALILQSNPVGQCSVDFGYETELT